MSEDFLSACEKAGKVVRPDAHMLNSASSASAASSAKQPPARKRAAPAPAAPAAAPQKVAARWYWADDSDFGHQDKWVEYDAARTAMLEKAFAAKQARVNVDTERFVSLKDPDDMHQARMDNPDRRRMVKREEDDAMDAGSDASDEEPDGAVAASAAPAAASAAPVVKWFWASDSANGMQDTWLEYDADASERYEAALQAGLTEVKVDDERFIDLKDMVQRRYDDKMKRRTVKRTETTKRSIAQSDGSPRKKRRVDDSGGAAAASHNTSDDEAPGGAAAPTVGHLALPNCPAHWDSFDSVSALPATIPSCLRKLTVPMPNSWTTSRSTWINRQQSLRGYRRLSRKPLRASTL